jgi:hypothetical protein
MMSSAISDTEFNTLELQALAIAESELMASRGVPVEVARANAVAKVLAARELGLPPVATALTGLYIIEGRLTLASKVMHALLMRSGLVGMEVLEASAERCAVRMWRTDCTLEITEELTIQQAEVQGLTRTRNGPRDNWKNHPGDMLWARVLSRLARRVAPDVTGGLYAPEEFGETPETARFAEVREAAQEPVSPRLGHQRAEDFRQGFLKGVLVRKLGIDVNAAGAEYKRIRDTRFGGRTLADLTVAEAEALREDLSKWALGQKGEPVPTEEPEEALEGDFGSEPAQVQEPGENQFPQGAMTPFGTWRTVVTAQNIDADVQVRLLAAARGHRHPEEVSAHEAAPPNDPDEMDALINVTVALLAGEMPVMDLPLVREEGTAQRLDIGGDA